MEDVNVDESITYMSKSVEPGEPWICVVRSTSTLSAMKNASVLLYMLGSNCLHLICSVGCHNLHTWNKVVHTVLATTESMPHCDGKESLTYWL